MKNFFRFPCLCVAKADKVRLALLVCSVWVSFAFQPGFSKFAHAEDENNSLAQSSYTHEQKQELADHALHILGGNANVISRWTENIRLALVADTTSLIEQHVENLVAELAGLTGLQGKVLGGTRILPADYVEMVQRTGPYDLSLCNSAAVDSADCANLVVVISDIETVRRLATAIPLRGVYQRAVAGDSEPYCFFAPFVGGRRDIRQGFVFVRDDLGEAMTQTCLQEELYQTFGLFNDASGSDWFSFNNRVEPKSITPMDKLLLQTVYSPEFRPGAPAYAVVRQFLKNLDKAE